MPVPSLSLRFMALAGNPLTDTVSECESIGGRRHNACGRLAFPLSTPRQAAQFLGRIVPGHARLAQRCVWQVPARIATDAPGRGAYYAAGATMLRPASVIFTRATSIVRPAARYGAVVGRIMQAAAAPVGMPWMWTLAFGHHEDRSPTHGYAPTCEAAMAAFAKSWRRE